jgi:N-acylglucosamine 2-epimerase
LDADGSVVDTDKAVWAQGRMAWMLLTLYNTWQKHDQWLEWGRSGVEFLVQHAIDTDGRLFFHLTQDGRPIRKRRYAFSETFASIACGALYRATKEPQWKQHATELFESFYDLTFTPGNLPPKFCDTRPMIGIGPRMITIATAQALRDDLGVNQKWQSWIDQAIHEISTLFVKHDLEAVMESVSPEGAIVDHFDGRILNPGHSVEAAWFVLEEGRYQQRAEWIELGCRMLDYSWRRGWDSQYGGLFYFRDVFDRPVTEYWHDMKFWWPHNEAIIASLMAFRLTGQQRYAEMLMQVHNWSYQHFWDAQHGEWFAYLHRDGRLSSTLKGNMWKSFFHYPRMLWKCCQELS